MDSEIARSASFYKAWAWVENNKNQVLTGAVVALVVGVIIWFILWQRQQKQVSAGQALSAVVAAQMTAATPRSASADTYLKVATEHSGSQAAARATVLAAASLFDDGKYAEALTLFQKFNREYPGSPLMGQALLGIAAAYDAQGKTDEALTAYKNIVEKHSTENVVPQAKFALARIYEAQKKADLARPLYEDIWRADRFGSLGSEAGMRLEELPKPAPILTPATNAPAPKVVAPMAAPATKAPAPTAPATK